MNFKTIFKLFGSIILLSTVLIGVAVIVSNLIGDIEGAVFGMLMGLASTVGLILWLFPKIFKSYSEEFYRKKEHSDEIEGESL